VTTRVLPALLGVILAISILGARQDVVSRVERPVSTSGSGPRRLPVDLPLLRDAAHFPRLERIQHRDGAHWRGLDGLADLRLVDAGGRDVPYLLVYPGTADPGWQDGTVLPIDTVRDKSSGFEVDLGTLASVDALHVEGIPPPFLKRLVLEGSGDRQRWTVLDDEGTLFDLPQEALKQVSVPFAAGTYRYLRVTWNDTNSGRVPLPRSARARLADATTAATPATRVEVTIEPRPSEPGRSRYRVRLPAGRLPAVALVLEVGGGHVYRAAAVYESALQGTAAAPLEMGRATLSRIVREGAVAEDLRVPIRRPRDVQLELSIEDGNNPPLDVRRVWVELAELPWIYFEAPGGDITARYGTAGVTAPRYDLEAARSTIRIGDVADARWGDPVPATPTGTADAPEVRRPQPGPAIDLSGYRYQRTLSSAPGLAVVALDAALLAHSRGPDAGFADLRIVDADDRQIPYLLERLQEQLSVPVAVERTEATARELTGEGRNLSVYALRPPVGGLPASSLVIETSGRLFTRGVRVGLQRPPDRSHRDAWFQEVAAARWTHTDEEGSRASLSLRLPAADDQPLVLVIDEGDNSPLPVTSARLLLPAYRLRFYAPEGPARLVYGSETQGPPQYDFELLATRILGAEATEVSLGEERGLGGGSSAEGPQLLSPRVFWAGLAVAVLVLGALIVRMLRTREG
jgi:hypothetical protein